MMTLVSCLMSLHEFLDIIQKRLLTNHQRVQLMSFELLEYLVSVSSNQEVLKEFESYKMLKLVSSIVTNSMFSEVH